MLGSRSLEKRPLETDEFAQYEVGIRRLLGQIDSDDSVYLDALTLEARLLENLVQSRQYGDTDTRRADRYRIIHELNRIALAELGTSFNELLK